MRLEKPLCFIQNKIEDQFMKSIIGLLILLTFASSGAQAKTYPVAHAFPRLEKTKIANLGSGCRLRLKLPARAELGARYESKVYSGAGGIGIDGLPTSADRWGMSLQCSKSDQDYVASGWAVKKMGKWGLNENQETAELVQLGALNFYKLKARNSEGWAVTYDDTYGEDHFRQRTLAYCLIKEDRAVCGESKVGFLYAIKDNKRNDFTVGALSILRQFEFLNDLPN